MPIKRLLGRQTVSAVQLLKLKGQKFEKAVTRVTKGIDKYKTIDKGLSAGKVLTLRGIL